MKDNSPKNSKVLIEEEENYFVDLRPKRLNIFVGQNSIKENIKILIAAAKNRKEPLEHVLFYGPPGLGKTTLAQIIAQEMEVNIKITSGPAIERQGDLAAILTNLNQNDIFFIDEIHRLSRPVEETLYPAMEDFKLDIVIGKGPSARSIRLDLPRFTLIGATTRAGLLTSPLRDRFGFISRFEFYMEKELEEIIMHSAKILNVKIDSPAAAEISRRSRGTPRMANRLLRRVRDWAQVKGEGEIDLETVKKSLESLSVDHLGLDNLDRKILGAIIARFNGGPAGIDAISAAIAEEPETLEDVYEPYLLQIGFIERTSRGRLATAAAYKHLGIPWDKEKQERLF